MKKNILILGAPGVGAKAIAGALGSTNANVVLIADALMEIEAENRKKTETFTIFAPETLEMPDFDPTLDWPKSYQDPKGEKTGSKMCEMSTTKRKQLKQKRKKRKKRKR